MGSIDTVIKGVGVLFFLAFAFYLIAQNLWYLPLAIAAFTIAVMICLHEPPEDEGDE